MSNDPVNDGINAGMNLTSSVAGPLVKIAAPLLLLSCFFSWSLAICIWIIAPVIGIWAGIVAVKTCWPKLQEMQSWLAQKKWGDLHGDDFRRMRSDIFKIAVYGFRDLDGLFHKARKKQTVCPGDDTPPEPENGYIQILPGPHWLNWLATGVVKLFKWVVLIFSVMWLWLVVIVVSFGYMLHCSLFGKHHCVTG